MTYLVDGFFFVANFTKPKSLAEQLRIQQEKRREMDRALGVQATQKAELSPMAGKLRLGVKIKGDRFNNGNGVEENSGWLQFDQSLLDQHMFVLGATGAGKSETLKRIIYETLVSTDRDVFFIDGKGDASLALGVRSLAHRYGRGVAPIFRLGFSQNGAVYNGFNGHATDVYNRLAALIGVREAEGNATFYADLNRDILQLVCFAPVGCPRSFEEVRDRISKEWLLTAYKDDPYEVEAIEGLSDRDIAGLAQRIRPLQRVFSKTVGPEGFSLEETRCAIFSMRTQSVGDTAERFLEFLVEDVKDFMGKRQRRPALLIVDEFGQFNNASIIALLSLARSSQMGVVLATQDTSNLKDPENRRLVLANTRTKILMATDFPEEVGTLAGTILQLESSMQHMDGDTTGAGSSRIQHAFKIDMNEVAALRAGEAFVIRQRRAGKVHIRRIGDVPLIEDQRPQIRELKRRKIEKQQQIEPSSIESELPTTKEKPESKRPPKNKETVIPKKKKKATKKPFGMKD
ncbi:MAG: hypothetical protein AAF902_10330 [Chloroflexota bacterium]